MIGRFRNGALANLEATRFAPGRKNSITLEINGSAGSLVFDFEEMNRLRFYNSSDPEGRRGFRDILVTEPTHPFVEKLVAARPSHRLRTHLRAHDRGFRAAVVRRKNVQPTFEDGLRNQRVLDAISRSAKERRAVCDYSLG